MKSRTGTKQGDGPIASPDQDEEEPYYPGPTGPCTVADYQDPDGGPLVCRHLGQRGWTLESAKKMMLDPDLIAVHCWVCDRCTFIPAAGPPTPIMAVDDNDENGDNTLRLPQKRFDKTNFLSYPVDLYYHIREHKVQDWFLAAFCKPGKNFATWSCPCNRRCDKNLRQTKGQLKQSLVGQFMQHFLENDHTNGEVIYAVLAREGDWSVLDTFDVQANESIPLIDSADTTAETGNPLLDYWNFVSESSSQYEPDTNPAVSIREHSISPVFSNNELKDQSNPTEPTRESSPGFEILEYYQGPPRRQKQPMTRDPSLVHDEARNDNAYSPVTVENLPT
ncbi:hypothetical protein M408DRAFT_29724 [Serendipita vermifera MAFF 305830]|uniref:Uncharacterized protein n=1 Tax=Serendipita vermifera MAFF 305830 TaxID=933852 RepID=A0A0C3A9C0_SERVB|nr:hypothetical protein M408DRAFT_29724 [Serendipita vermifera MAFF 305830]